MRIINHAYPQQQQQQHHHQQQQQQQQYLLHHHHHQHPLHHPPPQLPAPPHHPTPLPAVDSIDNNPSSATNSSTAIDHPMSHTHDDRRVTHDHAPRSSYSNSPATLSHHERPTVDHTNLRALLHDWRVDHQHNNHHLRNGDRDQPSSSSSNNKRKLEDSHDELQSKIRRIVRDHLTMDYSRPMSMTTVICLHAAVAQKSYGSEKRFLCPPPVVRIETPYSELKNQHLAMSIVTESGERGPEQRSPLDNNMVANFKYLHVSGTAKSKSFQLALDIAESPLTHPPPHLSPTDAVAPITHHHHQHQHHHPHPHESSPSSSSSSSTLPGRIWASFDSAPVTIISKPSKKTAKTRNISSCILAGGPVSLFNRINSQTVRTKYMTIEHAQLCASNLSWSAFNVNVLRRPHDNMMISNQAAQSQSHSHSHSSTHSHSHMPIPAPPLPVIYGCEIQLLDTLTGIATSPLIIRKVDKGKVSPEDGGPVSQMQKIALQRVNPDGSRSYLSAASPVSSGVGGSGSGAGGSSGGGSGGGANGSGSGGSNGSGGGAGSPGPPPPTPGSAGQPASHPLIFQPPRVREEVRDGVRIITDEVDDYLCWTIVGISKFQYTFFDGSGTNSPIPRLPITPFPTLFTAPGYRITPHTIELTVSNFFYTNPETMQHTPLEVWLGPIGPLRQRVFQATGPPGPLTNIAGLNGFGSGGGATSPIQQQQNQQQQQQGQPQLSVALNGLPSTLVNSLASLNGIIGVGGMMNLYGQQGSAGGGNGSGNGNGADGGGSEGGGSAQISPTATTTGAGAGAGAGTSQPPTPSATGNANSSNSNPQQSPQILNAPTPSSVIHSPPTPTNPTPSSTATSTTSATTIIPHPISHPHPHPLPHSLPHSLPHPHPPHSPPVAPPRFMPQGPLHTIVLVELPPMSQIVRTARESVGLPSHLGYLGESVPGIPGLEMGINLGVGMGMNMNMNMGLNVNAMSGMSVDNIAGVGEGESDVKHPDEDAPQPPQQAHSSGSATSSLPPSSSTSTQQTQSQPQPSSSTSPPPPPHAHAPTSLSPPPPLPTLPILFMRPYDGIGYHSGRSIACEPSLSHEQVERIQRRVVGGVGVGNGNGNGSAGGKGGGGGGVKEESAGVSNGHGGHGHGLLDGDIDWVVRVL